MTYLSCGHVATPADGPDGMGWPVMWQEDGHDLDGPYEATVYAVYCSACRKRGVARGEVMDDSGEEGE